jgi:hypothetical protein
MVACLPKSGLSGMGYSFSNQKPPLKQNRLKWALNTQI